MQDDDRWQTDAAGEEMRKLARMGRAASLVARTKSNSMQGAGVYESEELYVAEATKEEMLDRGEEKVVLTGKYTTYAVSRDDGEHYRTIMVCRAVSDENEAEVQPRG
ncbi:hypothetical protein R3P38DRAFT_2785854 [Favolaschia claudopus]|uniref:Uncharacterized protein n=1 Tax=Favolaschia claudopus TaxID=2862362 RepID=A0AAW0ATG5_9AGAR